MSLTTDSPIVLYKIFDIFLFTFTSVRVNALLWGFSAPAGDTSCPIRGSSGTSLKHNTAGPKTPRHTHIHHLPGFPYQAVVIVVVLVFLWLWVFLLGGAPVGPGTAPLLLLAAAGSLLLLASWSVVTALAV